MKSLKDIISNEAVIIIEDFSEHYTFIQDAVHGFH